MPPCSGEVPLHEGPPAPAPELGPRAPKRGCTGGGSTPPTRGELLPALPTVPGVRGCGGPDRLNLNPPMIGTDASGWYFVCGRKAGASGLGTKEEVEAGALSASEGADTLPSRLGSNAGASGFS